MTVRVRIPTVLRRHTGGSARVEIEGENVAQALQDLKEKHPGISPFLYSEGGDLRPQVNIYINDEHIRFRQGLSTKLHDGDLLYIMPIITGG